MAAGTSVIGDWQSFVDWGCGGPVFQATLFTFNANGTWTYRFGGGEWIQVEGLVIFNFSDAPGLIYSGNVTRDAVNGIMGYVAQQFSGCFYLIRLPSITGHPPPERAEVAEGTDVALGPQGRPPEQGVDMALGPEGRSPER